MINDIPSYIIKIEGGGGVHSLSNSLIIEIAILFSPFAMPCLLCLREDAISTILCNGKIGAYCITLLCGDIET